MPVRQMLTRPYILAVASFLAIPALFVPAMMLIILIDPGRVTLVAMGLWLLVCFFLIRSRKRSHFWLPLAVLGPSD